MERLGSRHQVPGRVRFKISGLNRDGAAADFLCRRLPEKSGVSFNRANPARAAPEVRYDTGIPDTNTDAPPAT